MLRAVPAALAALLMMTACGAADEQNDGSEQKMTTLNGAPPLVIAHRGASGERPEHTIAAYELAIAQGADFIEPDLVLTKDGVLVARHENEIGGTTNVADKPEFADRKTTKTIDGQDYDGWFTEDFTLAELKTLRAKERLPELRGANMEFDGQFEIPTFEEVLQLLKEHEAKTGKRVGIYPETKHPSYFASIGLAHDKPMLELLREHGFDDADDPVFIQSFETGNLRALATQTKIRLVQLVADEGGPPDREDQSYADMITPSGLAEIAQYASGLGPSKSLVIGRDTLGRLSEPTGLVAAAHEAGLVIHPWTFRRENYFLPTDYKGGINPAGSGDMEGEIRAYIAAGVDGLFSDNPAQAAAILEDQARQAEAP